MSDFTAIQEYVVESITKPIRYVIYKLTEFIRVVDKFVFRQVPSQAASGYATIEQIEGNTVVWNNLLSSGMFVDMGLPSGLLWASSNIDVTQPNGLAASPYQYECSFFSWGNVTGYNPVSNSFVGVYDWGSVNGSSPYYQGQIYGSTSGCSLTGDIPVGDTYDAGRQNVRSLWKMPSSADFQELLNNCDFLAADGTTIPSSTTDKRITYNGVVGVRLKSQINGNELFFACCGYGAGTSLIRQGDYGTYWQSGYTNERYAKDFLIYSGAVTNTGDNRHYGFAIRPVIAPVSTITTGHSNHKYAMNGTYNNCYDLTATFGSGNEPSTVADFESWLAQNIGTLPYYDYNAGELLSVKMQSVKSVGFNLWDEQCEEGGISPSTGQNEPSTSLLRSTNYIQFPKGSTLFMRRNRNGELANVTCFDSNKNFLGSAFNYGTFNNGSTFDVQPGSEYIRFTLNKSIYGNTYNHDICINISDPAKNGTYKPYQSDSADIDVTSITGINTSTNVREVIFADGMKQADYAGTVKDELDLVNGTATVNVGSRAYQSGDESDTAVITDGTTTYYALTTPITYTDLQDANGNPLNPRYKVEQGGTEQVLPANTSTPTTVAPTLTTTYTKA